MQYFRWMTLRYREQAHSYRKLCRAQNLAIALTKCGSGLAREEVGTSHIYAVRHTAFASKPAPTGDLCRA